MYFQPTILIMIHDCMIDIPVDLNMDYDQSQAQLIAQTSFPSTHARVQHEKSHHHTMVFAPTSFDHSALTIIKPINSPNSKLTLLPNPK